jgi:uncharacterized membrane protein
MNFDLIVKIILFIHIAAGAGALLFGAMAFAFRKNTPKHMPVGRIYFWCMTVVFISAVFLSIVKSLLFLFMIGMLSYYSTIIAYRSLRLKNLHSGQKPLRADWFIEITALIAFSGLVIFGILNLTKGNNGGIIPLVFGSFGLLSVRKNIKLFLKPPTRTGYWLQKHIGHMMGSYIGAFTAFLVNQTDKIPLDPIILWFLPSAIIVPVLVWEIRKIKQQPITAEVIEKS